MYYSRPGRHPLGGAVGDEPTAAVGIAVFEHPVHHVGDRLKSSMGMVRRSLCLAGCVLNRTHVVQEDERIG
jgi:hypothetical protein